MAKEAFGVRTSASTLAAVRDGVKDVAFVVVTHASNSEMSLAIKSGVCASVTYSVSATDRICCRPTC